MSIIIWMNWIELNEWASERWNKKSTNVLCKLVWQRENCYKQETRIGTLDQLS